MHRIRLTLVVAATLCLSYQGYAQWAESFTRIEVEPPPLAPSQAPAVPGVLKETAERLLPDEQWMPKAKFTFQRSDELFLYTDSADIVDDANGNRVQFAPFAMIWIDPEHPDAQPYIVRCESARVQFERPFKVELDAESPGRLVSAALDGVVSITGPDNLEITGQNFVFSEESLHLYSDFGIEFHYGPRAGESNEVHGSAHGVQINLLPGFDAPLGKDMPRVSGIRSIALRRDVVLDLTYEERRDDDKPRVMTARVTCDRSLEYHVEERYVTLESNVLVERPTGGEERPLEADRLRCNLLAMEFLPEGGDADPDVRAVEEPVEAEPASADQPQKKEKKEKKERGAHPFSGLRFSRLMAEGNRAALQSDEHELIANMHRLDYDASTGLAMLSDDEAVRVQRDETKLMCPVVKVWRDPHGDAQSLQCEGAGQLEQRDDETSKLGFRAFWDERLLVQPDPESGLTVIRADGRARVIQPEQTGLMADHITLWIDRDTVEQQQQAGSVRGGAAGGESGLAVQALKLALAEGNVVMAGPQFQVETSRLQATFESGVVPDEAKTHRDARQTNAEAPVEKEPDPGWFAQAQEIEVRIVQDPESRNTRVAEAIATGGIRMVELEPPPAPQSDQKERKPHKPVSLSGSRLHLTNQGGTQQVVNLFGSPAELRQGEVRLEGQDLRLDRGANIASIVGGGLMQVPVGAGLDGEELEVPMLLDVQWQEGMTFDGQEARFLKNVLLRLNDSRLNCEEMTVGLTQRIRFADEEAPGSDEIQIQQVQCNHGVHLEIYEWDQSRLVGIRKGELARFTLNHQTGEFYGQGPGTINDWTRKGSRRIAIAPKAVARANEPVVSDDLEWQYMNLRFSQSLKGNYKQKLVELNGRVRVLYAPVEHALETFSRDELSGESRSTPHAVWLGCDSLSITLHPRDMQTESSDEEDGLLGGDYAMIGGSGHCELEGQLFRAVADHLSFDESKNLFTLKGLGTHEASIYYQERPGADPSRFPGQTIQFIPSQQRVKLEGSSGIQGVR